MGEDSVEKYQSHIAGGLSVLAECSRPYVCIAFIHQVPKQLKYCQHSSVYLRDGKLSTLLWIKIITTSSL